MASSLMSAVVSEPGSRLVTQCQSREHALQVSRGVTLAPTEWFEFHPFSPGFQAGLLRAFHQAGLSLEDVEEKRKEWQ